MASDHEFFWEHMKHEDTLFTNRSNFFLVAEAMLFAAAGEILGGQTAANRPALWLIYSTGLFISGLWFFVSVKHLFFRDGSLTPELEDTDERYKRIVKARKGWPSTHLLMGLVLPGVLSIVWVLFFHV